MKGEERHKGGNASKEAMQDFDKQDSMTGS